MSSENLIGQKINMLTVIGEGEPYISPSGAKRKTYRCRCECGNIKTLQASYLRLRPPYSCGCMLRSSKSFKYRPKDLLDDPYIRASVVVDIQHDLTVGQTVNFGGYVYTLLQKFPHHGLFLDPFGRHECFDWWTVQRSVRYGAQPENFRVWSKNK